MIYEEKQINHNSSKELKRADYDQQKLKEKYGKYGYDFSKNRIDIHGKSLSIEKDDCKMYMLPANDLRNFSMAYTENTHCDICYGGYETAILNMTSSPLSACVIVEDSAGQIQVGAWVWVNEEKDLFVFDNIEYHRDPDAGKYMDIILDYIKAIPYSNVQIGMGEGGDNFGFRAKEFPFGRRCETTEQVPAPNNNHLNIDEKESTKELSDGRCYSGYLDPIFVKKNNMIIGNNRTTEDKHFWHLSDFQYLFDAKDVLTTLVSEENCKEAEDLLKTCADLCQKVMKKAYPKNGQFAIFHGDKIKEPANDFFVKYEDFMETRKEKEQNMDQSKEERDLF